MKQELHDNTTNFSSTFNEQYFLCSIAAMNGFGSNLIYYCLRLVENICKTVLLLLKHSKCLTLIKLKVKLLSQIKSSVHENFTCIICTVCRFSLFINTSLLSVIVKMIAFAPFRDVLINFFKYV